MTALHVIALGAHPDDIEISMAGLLLHFARLGHRVSWVIATDGAAAGGGRSADLAARRAVEARDAAALCSAELTQLNFADGELAWAAEAPITIGRHLAEAGPDLIVTHALNDYHPDHRALARIVGDAAPPAVPVLRADNMLGLRFDPDLIVDIDATFAGKCDAIGKHASQVSTGAADRLATWSCFRAMQAAADFTYGEAYRVDPGIRVDGRRLIGGLVNCVML